MADWWSLRLQDKVKSLMIMTALHLEKVFANLWDTFDRTENMAMDFFEQIVMRRKDKNWTKYWHLSKWNNLTDKIWNDIKLVEYHQYTRLDFQNLNRAWKSKTLQFFKSIFTGFIQDLLPLKHENLAGL